MFFSFGSLVFALILAEVAPWTIDLPEARKFLFEKNDRLEKHRHEHDDYEIDKEKFFSNRFDSNSKHHDEHHDYDDHNDHNHDSYAKDYGYHSYTEKKVRGIVYGGSAYLDGLQRSIEHFTDLLDNCTRINMYMDRMNDTTNFNFTSYNAPIFNTSTTTESWRPMNERMPYNETIESDLRNFTEQCKNVTKASEHVRRLAELAVKATEDLRDIAYSRKHMKDDPHELSIAENELILKLAWFLDRLAYYTDFRPQPKRHMDYGYPTSTTPLPPVPNMLNATNATKMMMMNCLKQKSDIPATIRCAYPQEIPGIVQAMINNSNPVQGGVPSSSNRDERIVPPAYSEQELLITTDHRHMYLPYHHLSSVRHAKRSVPDLSLSKSDNVRHKRALSHSEVNLNTKKENPAITFMKYFVKSKIWQGDNPLEKKARDYDRFEVENKISRRTKREVGKRLKLPEDPYQDLSKYVKNKKGVNYVKDEALAEKMRAYVHKILNSKPTTGKEQKLRISKLFRPKRAVTVTENAFRSKRSYTYEKDVDKPREPDDLFKDLSFYVKNKPGTNFNRDFVQAAQVRAGLLAIFANPDIEVVRRYGSNFNPLIPDPLLFGAMRSAADNK